MRLAGPVAVPVLNDFSSAVGLLLLLLLSPASLLLYLLDLSFHALQYAHSSVCDTVSFLQLLGCDFFLASLPHLAFRLPFRV
jgi:hypothetical protein